MSKLRNSDLYYDQLCVCGHTWTFHAPTTNEASNTDTGCGQCKCAEYKAAAD